MEKEPLLSFVIVNYKSRECLQNCISSIQKKVSFPFEIIIANNENSELDKSFSDNFKVIELNKNIGFGSAANKGAEISLGKFLCFLNPDTLLLSELDSLISEFEKNSQIGVVGVKLIDEKGATQNWIFGKKITFFSLFLQHAGFLKNKIPDDKPEKFPVDWVTGGALFIRKELFLKIGGFDENFFLYYEDVDLCRRIKEAGWQIVFFPSISIRHLGSQSFSLRQDQKKYYYASQKYYFKKYYGSFQAGLVDFLRRLTHN